MKYTEYIDGIPVHPHAAAYPMMSEGELQDLADDIKANGQHEPIIVANLHPNLMDDPHILDGRNRYAACKLAGVEPKFHTVSLLNPEGGSGQDEVVELTDDNIRRWIDSKNLHRRHLTPEQKRERIKAALSRNPELPDYQIAKRTNTSPHTVKRVRQDNPDLQGANERVNARGQKRPATYDRAPGFNPGDLEELNTTKPEYTPEQLASKRQREANERAARYIENFAIAYATVYKVLQDENLNDILQLVTPDIRNWFTVAEKEMTWPTPM